MSNDWLNIRFGMYHLQAGDPWWKFSISANNYYWGKPWRVEVFTLFGHHFS